MDKAQRQHLDNLRPEATEERQKELSKGANQALHALAPVYSLVILQHSTYKQVRRLHTITLNDAVSRQEAGQALHTITSIDVVSRQQARTWQHASCKALLLPVKLCHMHSLVKRFAADYQ